MKRKKLYRSPIIELVNLDRELVLLSTSDGTPPDQPGPLGTAEKPSSPNPNKFKDNPFEK